MLDSGCILGLEMLALGARCMQDLSFLRVEDSSGVRFGLRKVYRGYHGFN